MAQFNNLAELVNQTFDFEVFKQKSDLDQQYFSNLRGEDQGQIEYNPEKHEQIKQQFKQIVQNYVAFLLQNNILKPIQTKHSVLDVIKYNTALNSKEDRNDFLCRLFTKIINFYYLIYSIDSEYTQDSHNNLISKMIQGTVKDSTLDISGCSQCNHAPFFYLEFEQFNPYLVTYAGDGGGKPIVISEDESCFEEADYTFTIDCPSGELLCSDWLRDENEIFTEIVEVPADERYNKYSLNKAIGRKLTTEWYAQQHNFISVSVGDGIPRMHLNKGKNTLKCGDKKNGSEGKGSICTDYWGVTVIDKQTLTDLLIKHQVQNIDQVMKELLESVDLSGCVVKVKPGKYEVTVHPDNHVEKGFRECFFTMKQLNSTEK